MSGIIQNTTFSFEYIVSIVVIILVCDFIIKKQPQLNMVIVILIGLVTGYLTLLFINSFFPTFSKVFTHFGNYLEFEILNNFNNTGYAHVWPPIMAILIVFIILLYGRFLG